MYVFRLIPKLFVKVLLESGIMQSNSAFTAALNFEVLKPSFSPILAEIGDKIFIHVKAYYADNKQLFWQTYNNQQQQEPNKPILFKVGSSEVLQGWDEGVVGMRKGEIRKLFVPAHMAYGKAGFPEFGIGENADLIFDIELVEVKNKENNLPRIQLHENSANSANITNAEDNKIILFLHGWPDDESVFDMQRTYFSTKGFTCFSYTLPWFGEKTKAKKDAMKYGYKTFGYSHEQLVDGIAAAYTTLFEHSSPKRAIIVGHDWGGFHAQLLKARHPHLVSKSVIIDVAFLDEFYSPTFSDMPRLVLGGIIYQYPMILAHLLSQFRFSEPVGEFISRKLSQILKSLMLRSCNPKYATKAANKTVDTTGNCGYVYYYLHRDIIMRMIGFKGPGLCQKAGLNDDIFFLYGSKMPKIHSTKWRLQLGQSTGSAAMLIDCGHWIQVEEADICNTAIHDYINGTHILKPKL